MGGVDTTRRVVENEMEPPQGRALRPDGRRDGGLRVPSLSLLDDAAESRSPIFTARSRIDAPAKTLDVKRLELYTAL